MGLSMSKIDDVNSAFHYDSKFQKDLLFNPDIKPENKKIEKKSKIKKDSFKDILMSEETEQEPLTEVRDQEIELLLKEIGIQGETLKKRRTLEDLDIYKKKVKKFMMSIVELSEKTEKKTVWNRLKKEKITKVHLQIIDNELLELTRIFMSEQSSVLEIASKLDRIQGILVDMAS
jgi:uncharacterized protein